MQVNELSLDQDEPAERGDNNGAATAAGEDEKKAKQKVKISSAQRSLLLKIISKGLLDTKAQVEVKQKDPTSPLYSAKSFEDLKL